MKSNKKNITPSQLILLALLILLCVLVLFPFVLMIIKSFKTFDQEYDNPLSLTFPIELNNYLVAWIYVKSSIFNSIFVSSTLSLSSVILSFMGAYGFAKFKFKGNNLLFMFCVSLMMVPGVLVLTSKYVLTTNTLNLFDSYIGVIIPQMSGLLPFGILLLRGAIDDIPNDLFEAGKIDGASSTRQFISIALPIAKPLVVTLFLMNFMTSWNDYLWPSMILRDPNKITIPVQLASFTDSFYDQTNYYAPVLAGYVIVSLPMMVLFAFTSKQFISGMTSGAVKM